LSPVKTTIQSQTGGNCDQSEAGNNYVNTYTYDLLGRVTQIAQAGVTGGNCDQSEAGNSYSDVSVAKSAVLSRRLFWERFSGITCLENANGKTAKCGTR
jgi:hypothetical protein